MSCYALYMNDAHDKNLLERKFSVAETAQILGQHPITIRRKLADKSLGFYKLGGRIFVGESHLADYIARSERKPLL